MYIKVKFNDEEQEIAFGSTVRGRIDRMGKRPTLLEMGGYKDVLRMKEPERSKAISWVFSHLAPSLSPDSDRSYLEHFREVVEAFNMGRIDEQNRHDKEISEDKKIADSIRTIAGVFHETV